MSTILRESCEIDPSENCSNRYDDVVTFLADAEELLGIYDLDSRDLNVPPAHAFDE